MLSNPRRHDGSVEATRFRLVSLLVTAVFATLLLRLWYVQIYRGPYYRKISENNRMRRIEIPAARGMIFDRHGQVIVGNRPFFDLVMIPQYVTDREKTLHVLSNLLHEPRTSFDRMFAAHRGRPKFLPVTIMRNLTLHEVSLVETNKIFPPGVEIAQAPRRDYRRHTPAHIVGYLGEINAQELKSAAEEHGAENPYLPGDLIGKQGLEARWEKLLRGSRGYRLIQVDALGRQTRLFERHGWELPIREAVPGADVVLTLDMELQRAVADAFQGKYGAVVVLDPRTGEILAMLSSPSYDPAMYQDSLSVDKWRSLISDPYKPLFDKTTGGAFAPGSVYKPVVAFAALEEGVSTTHDRRFCSGHFELGREIFHCHRRRGHGMLNLEQAMATSCDTYFYEIGVELGVDRIAKYAHAFGLGQKLGVGLNHEDPGLIPSTGGKGERPGVSVGDAPPISIGQGANLMTPIQIASLYATIANGGTVWKPFLVRKVTSHLGDTLVSHEREALRQVTEVSPQNFARMRRYLREVVEASDGTGHRARLSKRSMAGKTGSAQVVSLKKNRNRKSVTSMKWQEHAMFAGFSPVEDAEVVVAVVSENDTVGGGASAAAPIARRIISAFWRLKEKRLLAARQPGGTP